jgi:aspartate carbamoyltransferase catalytic subunit
MAGDIKQESLEDTVRTVAAMGAVGIALRHPDAGAPQAAVAAAAPGIAVINGGNNCESHPTQGLTDAYTIRERVGDDFSGLSVAIVGDVLHSRVARSNLHMLRIMGATDIRLVGPPELCPQILQNDLGASVFSDLEEAINSVDIVILLRVQRERLRAMPQESDYFRNYGLTAARLAMLKKDVMILHPGPINRGVEISDSVADGPQSMILRQVTNGMAIRKAVLSRLCST